MSFMFGNSTTYIDDKYLFDKLGLKTFSLENNTEFYCGQVNFEDKSYVKVWVSCYPAQFWRFEVFCADTGKLHYFKTGSGSFRDYYPSMKFFAEGMIVNG